MIKLKTDIANYFMLVIIINIFLHYLIPIKQIVFLPYGYLGIALFIVGWIPNFWIGIHFRKIKTPIPAHETPKKLVSSGLFKISRNPNYLGMTLALFGEAIFLGSLVTFILPVLFFILINIFNIPFEEKILEKKFGKRYIGYKNKVRKWI